MLSRVTPTGLFLLSAGWVATTTRQRTPSGPTGMSGQSYRLRTICLCSPLLNLIWGQMQARLDLWMIKDTVLFAARHKREADQVREHRSRAILAIEPEEGLCMRKLVGCQIATDGSERLAQFLPLAPVTAVAKGAEPVETVGLTDDGARAYHLATFAPGVARSAHVLQPAEG